MKAVIDRLDYLIRQVDQLGGRIDALETHLRAVVVSRLEKDWYTTDEVAVLTGRAPWTVREWCRLGRIRAKKSPRSDKWVVSKLELKRLLNDGLLRAEE